MAPKRVMILPKKNVSRFNKLKTSRKTANASYSSVSKMKRTKSKRKNEKPRIN